MAQESPTTDQEMVSSKTDHAKSHRVLRMAPLTRKTIYEVLEEARAKLVRLTPREAYAASLEGGILVDTRCDCDRREQGLITHARHYPLSTLEWELELEAKKRDAFIKHDSWIILLCKEGYSSSLAARRLKDFGFERATDVIGGVEGWKVMGLPLEPFPLARPRGIGDYAQTSWFRDSSELW